MSVRPLSVRFRPGGQGNPSVKIGDCIRVIVRGPRSVEFESYSGAIRSVADVRGRWVEVVTMDHATAETLPSLGPGTLEVMGSVFDAIAGEDLAAVNVRRDGPHGPSVIAFARREPEGV